ncbi:unnamed protein product [Schistosoma mattheei]|uniref:Uncharacterized protein n=1 Tax=Schistosoma mattheei TaxID=31246 RepID=A0A183PUH5_9TREM|nr:unnamed protein product [Schistosoma mattheei]
MFRYVLNPIVIYTILLVENTKLNYMVTLNPQLSITMLLNSIESVTTEYSYHPLELVGRKVDKLTHYIK